MKKKNVQKYGSIANNSEPTTAPFKMQRQQQQQQQQQQENRTLLHDAPNDSPSASANGNGNNGLTTTFTPPPQHMVSELSQDSRTHPLSSSSSNSNLFKLVAIAAATAATLGYDVGIMAAAIQPLEADMGLNDVQKEFAMGSLNFIAALGALLGGYVSNRYGRKRTIYICSWLFVVGTVFMAAATGFWTLLGGRLVTGLGVGVSFVVAPVFLSEVAPTDKRGELNTVFDVAINGGILLGYVVGFLVQIISPGNWRVMLGLGLVLPIIVLWFLGHLPESPRYLVMVNEPLEAQRVLLDLGDEQPEETVASITAELESTFSDRGGDTTTTSIMGNFSWKSMRMALSLGFWQQITGTEAVLYYSADFLAQAGLQSTTQRLLGNVFVGLCKLTPEVIAMKYVDTIGRRPLMLISAVALCLSTATLSMAFGFGWSPYVVVILLCAVMASFSIGLGPFSFLLASETLGLTERATGMTYCAAVNRLTSGTVALTSVSMYSALGGSGFFAFYAGVGFLSLFFYFRELPETSGQSLEELAAARARQDEENSANKNQQRQDSNYTREESDITGAELT